jgi:hypothetical protein
MVLLTTLTHDRLTLPLDSKSAVQHVVRAQRTHYRHAEQTIGLTPSEAGEFERRLAHGQVKRTTLPLHLDAMAGLHRDRVYALHDVRVLPNNVAYVVVLDDGKRVYIPAVCGNISVVHAKPPVVAVHHAVHRTVTDYSPLGGGGGLGGGGNAVTTAAAPPPAPLLPDEGAQASAQASAAAPPPVPAAGVLPTHRFHIPGAAWVAGVFGGMVAWWTGGSDSSDACP